jgi:FemAB family protein
MQAAMLQIPLCSVQTTPTKPPALADWPFPAGQACQFVPLTESNRHDWQAVLAARPEQPVGYDLLHCAYQHAYFASAFADASGNAFANASANASANYRPLDCLILWHDKVVGVWPLALFGHTGEWHLSSHINGASGISPPLLLAGLSEKQEKTIARAWLGALARLCENFGVASLELIGAPLGDSSNGKAQLPYWHSLAMMQGAQLSGRHRLVADLQTTATAYHQQLRKSYKALINKARKLWQVSIDTAGDAEKFAAFQGLHEQVAGRQTRPASTWQAQFDAILTGAAYALYLHDSAGELVGASLFNRSRDEAYYAVGVYRRELFDQPLAHLSLDEAIRFARQQGLQRCILGTRAYPGDAQPPNAKEEKIAFFKEGFASGLQMQAVLKLSAEQLTSLQPT